MIGCTTQQRTKRCIYEEYSDEHSKHNILYNFSPGKSNRLKKHQQGETED